MRHMQKKKYFEQKRKKNWKWSTPQFFQLETSVALHRALKYPIPILKQSYNDVQKNEAFFWQIGRVSLTQQGIADVTREKGEREVASIL